MKVIKKKKAQSGANVPFSIHNKYTIGDSVAFKKMANAADSSFNAKAKQAGFSSNSLQDMLNNANKELERKKAAKASPPKTMKCGGKVSKKKKK